MAVSESFQTHVVEQMRRAGTTARTRRMFGGLGIYHGDSMFALIDDDVLYFKVDDATRQRYEANGMSPFRPYGDDRASMNYFTLPDSALDDPDELREWMDEAIGVAHRARAAKTKAKKRR